MTNKRYEVSRRFLIFWTLFIGIGAVHGAVCMFIDPSGGLLHMKDLLPYFKVLPFSEYLFNDYVFSGIALLIVNGLTNVTAAALLIAKKKAGVITGMIFGLTLIAWITIQFIIFPFNFLSMAYFVFGLLQFITGLVCYIGYRQKEFSFNENDYKNVGTDKSKLVVYFSRMGYCKKLAYETADETGADLFEVKTTERTAGNLGFWWCGRFAMHKWGMPIVGLPENLTSYEKVIIVTPVWDFSLCAPIREFCKQARGKIKSADYVVVHFLRGVKFLSVAKEADLLLGIKAETVKSVSSHYGSFKTVN